MLRKTTPLQTGLRNRKKYPYMISHHKLPWNVVEAGSEDAHKLLAPAFVRVFDSALSPVAARNLVRPDHPNDMPEEQWLFKLPQLTYIVPLVEGKNNSNNGQSLVESSLSPFDWPGKRVTDSMCLAHYGPLHSGVAPVEEVAEFKSPDLRIVCNAVRLGRLHEQRAQSMATRSALASYLAASKVQQQPEQVTGFCLFHYYRPNRAPLELLAAFKRFVPNEKPDLSALQLGKGSSGKKKKSGTSSNAVVSPMPTGPVPTSPLFGLAERDALRPGDTFGCRSRVWGHHW